MKDRADEGSKTLEGTNKFEGKDFVSDANKILVPPSLKYLCTGRPVSK